MKKTTKSLLLLLAANLIGLQAVPAQYTTVKLITAKNVGEEITFAVNHTYNGVNVNWGDGNIVVYDTGNEAIREITGTVKGNTITISGDEDLFNTLICPDCELTEIDLSEARKLHSLYCQDNKLSEIDLREMTELTDLDCSRNQISSIIYTSRIYPERDLLKIENINLADNLLSGSFAIRAATLKNLDVSGNQITSVNTTSNTNLDQLKCSNNRISSVSVATCDSISTLVCHDNNISKLALPADVSALQQLICDNNIIKSSIPLSNCTGLKDLSCSNNQISQIEMPANVKCSSLNFSGNKLTLGVLPRTIYKPDYILFTPQEAIDISSFNNVKTKDNVPYMDVVTWNERKTNPLDLSDYTQIATSYGSSGTNGGTIKWYYLDENGQEQEMVLGTSSIKSNDYYESAGKFTFFTEHTKAFARIKATTGSYGNEDFYIETSMIAIGENSTVGIDNVINNIATISVSPGKRSLTISGINNKNINVYSTDGTLVWNGTTGKGTVTIALPAGIYIVEGKKYSVQ